MVATHIHTHSFFIHGGLVFTPLTQPYLQEVRHRSGDCGGGLGFSLLLQYGEDWYNSSPRKLCMKALTEYMEEPDQEVRRPDARVAARYWDNWRLATERVMTSAAGRW